MSLLSKDEVDREWDGALPTLMEYISIQNVSPAFDKDWQLKGHTDEAMDLIQNWISDQKVPNLSTKLYKLEGRTPLLACELPPSGSGHKDILFYGHMDKQPPQTSQWSEGLGPYLPTMRDGKLYGRGGADDGYAAFLTTIVFKLLEQHSIPHGRLLLLLEASEESGSVDLPAYIDKLAGEPDENFPIKLGKPDLVVCLDSGCTDYSKMWLTTSLRGAINMDLKIATLTGAKHSGDAGGVVPEPFNVLRSVLDKLVNTEGTIWNTGLIDYMYKDIPGSVYKYNCDSSTTAMQDLHKEYGLLPQIKSAELGNLDSLTMKRVWLPTFTLIGIDGIPGRSEAANVIVPEITCRFSMRVPPYLKSVDTFEVVKSVLEGDPPYNALVKLDLVKHCDGWLMPYDDTLISAINEVTGGKLGYRGEGGAIPFMNMLSEKFPDAKFVVTGVLGPESNAHGPDEFLHLEYTKELTYWVACIVSKI
jgi:acetylornithine deacetylase/succinyl-diaminopimelate desuccinylase-like protein